jgi:hypothetical protein
MSNGRLPVPDTASIASIDARASVPKIVSSGSRVMRLKRFST